MGRKRFIDPEIWSSEQLERCSMGAAFFFMGLVTHDELTDDYGRGREDYHRMHRLLFAGRPGITQDIVRAWFNELAEAVDERGVGLVRRYVDTEGLSLFDLPSFVRRQPMKYRRKSILDEYVAPETLSQTESDCAELPQLAETCGNLRKLGDGIPTPIDTPTVRPGTAMRPRAVAVEKISIQSPPSKPALTCDVLQPETLGNVTTGMILKWMKDPKVFWHWEKLRHKVFAVNEQDPVTLLAHVIEINNSRLKSKPATLMRRLSKPRPGTKRRVPADKWYEKAKEMLNGTPTRREKSQPEQLGDILKKGGK